MAKGKDPYEVGYHDATAYARHQINLARAQLQRLTEPLTIEAVSEVLDEMTQALQDQGLPMSGDFG